MDETQSRTNSNNRKFNPYILIAGVLIIGLVGLMIARNNAQKEKSEDTSAVTQEATITPSANPTTGSTNPTEKSSDASVTAQPSQAGEEKVFTVKGSNFAFSPNELTVNKGDKVKIIFQDDDGYHDLVVDGYNVQTKTIGTGNSAEVEFTADKTGSFEYFCSVADHREQGMTGTLTVL